jgi:hypothetical protein
VRAPGAARGARERERAEGVVLLAPADYCREIEAYLCRKNDGHLIRIVGPAFELVARWAEQGIPFNVACAGIDRSFERYYRKGPRRRPVRVEFCEADVLDAFDDWRRAVGVRSHPSLHRPKETDDLGDEASRHPRRLSLVIHIERAIARLTTLRGGPASGMDASVADAVRDLDAMLGEARRARGDAREAIVQRLASIDESLIAAVMTTLDDEGRRRAEHEAKDALAPFRDRMSPDAFQRACQAALRRSVREHFGLPTVRYDGG